MRSWNVFFILLFFVPMILVWGFSLFDIFRRKDLGPAATALWLVSVIILPLVGTLLYLLLGRRGMPTSDDHDATAGTTRNLTEWFDTSSAAQLRTLADLHTEGKLTDSEYAAEKAKVTGITDGGDKPVAGPVAV